MASSIDTIIQQLAVLEEAAKRADAAMDRMRSSRSLSPKGAEEIELLTLKIAALEDRWQELRETLAHSDHTAAESWLRKESDQLAKYTGQMQLYVQQIKALQTQVASTPAPIRFGQGGGIPASRLQSQNSPADVVLGIQGPATIKGSLVSSGGIATAFGKFKREVAEYAAIPDLSPELRMELQSIIQLMDDARTITEISKAMEDVGITLRDLGMLQGNARLTELSSGASRVTQVIQGYDQMKRIVPGVMATIGARYPGTESAGLNGVRVTDEVSDLIRARADQTARVITTMNLPVEMGRRGEGTTDTAVRETVTRTMAHELGHMFSTSQIPGVDELRKAAEDYLPTAVREGRIDLSTVARSRAQFAGVAPALKGKLDLEGLNPELISAAVEELIAEAFGDIVGNALTGTAGGGNYATTAAYHRLSINTPVHKIAESMLAGKPLTTPVQKQTPIEEPVERGVEVNNLTTAYTKLQTALQGVKANSLNVVAKAVSKEDIEEAEQFGQAVQQIIDRLQKAQSAATPRKLLTGIKEAETMIAQLPEGEQKALLQTRAADLIAAYTALPQKKQAFSQEEQASLQQGSMGMVTKEVGDEIIRLMATLKTITGASGIPEVENVFDRLYKAIAKAANAGDLTGVATALERFVGSAKVASVMGNAPENQRDVIANALSSLYSGVRGTLTGAGVPMLPLGVAAGLGGGAAGGAGGATTGSKNGPQIAVAGDYDRFFRDTINGFDEIDSAVEKARQHLEAQIKGMNGVMTEFKYSVDATTGSIKAVATAEREAGNATYTWALQTQESYARGTTFRGPEYKSYRGSLNLINPTQDLRAEAGRLSTIDQGIATQTDELRRELEQLGMSEVEVSHKVDLVTNSLELQYKAVRQTAEGMRQEVSASKAFSISQTGAIAPAQPPKSFQESLRDMYGTSAPRVLGEIDKILGGAGLDASKITSVSRNAATGITHITAATKDSAGATTSLTMAFDKQGRSVEALNIGYNNFVKALEQGLQRQVRWILTANVVFGAFNALQRIPTVLATIDAEMAKLSAVTEISGTSMAKYFGEAATFADKYAVSLDDVIKISRDVFQATGGDYGESMKLLSTTMMYTKLAAEDMSTAFDTLFAAMGQMDVPAQTLDTYLAKWVTLFQTSKVSIQDFAQAVASAGSIASDLGMNIDEINAVIGTLSEVTTLSKKELGNFMRTILTNMTSDETINKLEQYGITIKDNVTGEYRNAYDVLREISELNKSGALLPGSLQTITRSLGGGGSRQSSRMAALINQFEIAEELRKVSQAATPETVKLDDIMAEMTNNLESDTQRMSNAFTQLVKDIGDAGLLDAMTNIVGAMGTVAKGIGEVVKGAEDLGLKLPNAFSTLAIGWGAGPLIGEKLSTSIGNALMKNKSLGNIAATLFGGGDATETGQKIGNSLAIGITAGISAGTSSGNALVGVISGAVGIGLTAATGSPAAGAFGAAIAQLVSEAIINGINEGKEYAERGRKTLSGEMTGYQFAKETEATNTQELMWKAFMAANEGSRYVTSGISQEFNAPYHAAWMAEGSQFYGLSKAENFEQFRANFTKLGLDTPENLAVLDKAQEIFEGSVNGFNQALESEKVIVEERNRAEELTAAVDAKRVEVANRVMWQNSAAGTLKPDYVQALSGIRRQISLDAVTGENPLSASEVKRMILRLQSGQPATSASIVGAALGSSNNEIYDMIGTLTRATDEQTQFLVEAAKQAMEAEIMYAEEGTEANRKEYETRVEFVRSYYKEIQDSVKSARASQLAFPTFQKVDINLSQVDAAYKKALALDQAKFNFLGYTAEEINTVKASFDDIFIEATDGFNKLTGVSAASFNQMLQKEEELKKKLEDTFNIQRQPDLDISKWGQFQELNNYWTKYLAQARGYDTAEQYQKAKPEDFQEFNFILKDNKFQKITSTAEAIQFVLQDILDTEKKQLEGQWNIPEGATFWVPLTSLFNNGNKNLPGLPGTQEATTPANKDILGVEFFDPILDALPGILDLTSQAADKLSNAGDNLIKGTAVMTTWSDVGVSKGGETPYSRQRDALQEMDYLLKGSLKRLGVLAEQYNYIAPITKTENPWMDAGARFGSGKTEAPQATGFWESLKNFFNNIGKSSLRTGGGLGAGDTLSMYRQTSSVVNVTIPEPKSFTVESNLTATIQMDGAVIGRLVKRYLQRELSKVVNKRTYTVPLNKV